MLTSSLQSTWDTQRGRQARPKYLQSSQYGDDGGEEKHNGQLSHQQRMFGNNLNNGSTDLPNLRIPNMNRNSLGGTATNFGASPVGQGNQMQVSPRADRRQDLGSTMTKKLRAVSRQSGANNQRTVKKNHRYDGGGSYMEGSTASGQEGSSSMFPQLPAVQGAQQLTPSQPSPLLSMTKKNAAYAHVGSLNTMSPAALSMAISQQHSNSNTRDTGNISGGHFASSSTPHHAVSNGNVTIEEHTLGAVTSIKGLKPGNPNWTNQDNFFVMEGPDVRIYGVLDGHGENGHHVSRRCRENFPHFIKSANGKMDLAFNMMHNDLNSSDFDVRCSGATCVVATINSHGRLCVFNCGDSRAVMGRRTPNGAIIAQQMSNDHKPDKPEERKRILSCGGHLGCRQVLVNQGNRGPVSMPVGPCRVWYQHRGETLGLAMSRSLGDAIVHKFGVTAEPELIEHPIDEFDEFLIIATDGVWDVVDNNHAVQMIHNFAMRSQSWSPLEAANCLVKFARSRWEKLSPMIDDITCIVIKLQPISLSS